jgi:hypothetical protein
MAGTLSPITVSTGLQQIATWVQVGDIALCSEAVDRGAGCGSSARPDLWGTQAGDRLGLPDTFALFEPAPM